MQRHPTLQIPQETANVDWGCGGGVSGRGKAGMEEGESPDRFTLQGMVHTHCHMLIPHHSSLPEKTQDSENAFHSETHQPGLRVTQQLSGGSNYPGHQDRRERG